MVSISGGSVDYGQVLQLLGGITDVRSQLDIASQQASSGKIAQTYGGLGSGARLSLDLRPQIAHNGVWQKNIDVAAGRLSAVQNALTGIRGIAADFYAKTNTLNGLSSSDASSVAAAAKQGIEQVAQLINAKVGDVYVFAGEDSGNPPLPVTDQATLTTALLASDTAQAPFSSTLGTKPASIEVGEGERLSAGLLANKNTLATSSPPTTGSYLRDILRSLATLTTIGNGPSLTTTAADVRARLSSALDTLNAEAGTLGGVQTSLVARRDQSVQTVTALQAQISNVEDVDLAVTASRVTSLQTQLQASYQILAGVKNLSLSKYL